MTDEVVRRSHSHVVIFSSSLALARARVGQVQTSRSRQRQHDNPPTMALDELMKLIIVTPLLFFVHSIVILLQQIE